MNPHLPVQVGKKRWPRKHGKPQKKLFRPQLDANLKINTW